MISPAQALLTGCIGTLFISALILAIVCIVVTVWAARHKIWRSLTGRAVALRAEPEVSALTGFHPYRVSTEENHG